MSTLRIAAVQYDIKWLDKEVNLARLESMINTFFISNTADLMLFPETFSTGFCIDDDKIQQSEDGGSDVLWLKEMAVKFSCTMAGTVFVKNGDKKANRFYWVSPDGSCEYYDKRHLFRMSKEDEYVTQGQVRKVIEIKGIKILPQVCYDLRFPVFSRNKQDYEILVNVANWPAQRRSIWDVLLKARAIENQVFVIGINRIGNDGYGTAHSGGTCMIDFTGQVLKTTRDNQQQVICHEIDVGALETFKKEFPAYLDADRFQME